MKAVIFLSIFLLVSCGNGKIVSPIKEIKDSAIEITRYLEEYRPGITEQEHSVGHVLEVVDMFHNATEYKHDERLLSFTAVENIEHILFDETYSVMCGGFALAVFDSLETMGYEVRLVQLFSEGINNHVVNEVFVDDKWIAVDTIFNMVFTDEDGNLLSYKEVKELYDTEGIFITETIGNANMDFDDFFEDYGVVYTEYLYNIRALPTGYKGMPYLDTVIEGEERY